MLGVDGRYAWLIRGITLFIRYSRSRNIAERKGDVYHKMFVSIAVAGLVNDVLAAISAEWALSSAPADRGHRTSISTYQHIKSRDGVKRISVHGILCWERHVDISKYTVVPRGSPRRPWGQSDDCSSKGCSHLVSKVNRFAQNQI